MAHVVDDLIEKLVETITAEAAQPREGRPSKFTADRAKAIIIGIRADGGCKLSLSSSAKMCGACSQTVTDWHRDGKAAGEDSTSAKRLFYLAVEAAEAEQERYWLDLVSENATGVQVTREIVVTEEQPVTDKDGNCVYDKSGKLCVIKVPVVMTVTDTERDTRSPIEILRRRFKDQYGDNIKQDVTSNGQTVKAYIGVALDDV